MPSGCTGSQGILPAFAGILPESSKSKKPSGRMPDGAGERLSRTMVISGAILNSLSLFRIILDLQTGVG